MSADYIDVSKEIEIEGIPVKVSALFWPDEDRISNPTAIVSEKNPDDDRGGFWEVEVNESKALVGQGEPLPPMFEMEHHSDIQEAAEEAAKATHV